MATLVADFVAVNLMGQKELYEKAKFRQVVIKRDGTARGLSFSDHVPGTTPHPRTSATGRLPTSSASPVGVDGYGATSTNDIDLGGGRQLAIDTRGGAPNNHAAAATTAAVATAAVLPAESPRSDRAAAAAEDEVEEPWGKAQIAD